MLLGNPTSKTQFAPLFLEGSEPMVIMLRTGSEPATSRYLRRWRLDLYHETL
jgi:hypothetical protein